MAKELKPFDATHEPGILRLAEEVHSTREPRVLRRDSEDLAIVMPVKPRVKRTPGQRKSGIITKDDSLWDIVSIADRPEDPIADVSENKNKYLAEAYADTHE